MDCSDQLDARFDQAAIAIDAAAVAEEGWADPAHGGVTWRTLIDADRTPSRGFVLGIAGFGPNGVLPAHRHAGAEFYLGLSGAGIVAIEGVAHPIGPGIAVYLPSMAEHAVLAGPEGLSFAYGFAADRFGDIVYEFPAAPASGAALKAACT